MRLQFIFEMEIIFVRKFQQIHTLKLILMQIKSLKYKEKIYQNRFKQIAKLTSKVIQISQKQHCQLKSQNQQTIYEGKAISYHDYYEQINKMIRDNKIGLINYKIDENNNNHKVLEFLQQCQHKKILCKNNKKRKSSIKLFDLQQLGLLKNKINKKQNILLPKIPIKLHKQIVDEQKQNKNTLNKKKKVEQKMYPSKDISILTQNYQNIKLFQDFFNSKKIDLKQITIPQIHKLNFSNNDNKLIDKYLQKKSFTAKAQSQYNTKNNIPKVVQIDDINGWQNIEDFQNDFI